MRDWITDAARELGVDPLSPEETGHLLNAARDVAHLVERKVTPLAMFIAGAAVEARTAAGAARVDSLAEVLTILARGLPDEQVDGHGSSAG